MLDNAPAFTGDSFLHYNDEPIAQNIIGNTNTFNLRVKIEAPNGLLGKNFEKIETIQTTETVSF